MGMGCDHSASHSGGARYVAETGQLQLILLCDTCGAERAHLGRIDYAPDPRRLVVQLAELTAREFGLNQEQTSRVRFAALVCGLGRSELTPTILRKRGPLTPKEWLEVRRQPELAAALLGDVAGEEIRAWILAHRERPDGSGYPYGLAGEQIPLEARILSVADAYSAMVSERPHRPARGHQGACLELVRCAGTQFDVTVVKAFLKASLPRSPHYSRAAI
jgi:HD-GYP domain-containing protein (c-di-GMP phosphodiesterase class II)